MPSPGPHELLVRIEAVSVNPIDLKMRRAPPARDGSARILGWDAAGVVQALGGQVAGFAVGDEVYYAGSIARPGCFAQAQTVDHRLVAHKPASLSYVEAAALPLCSLAAWEALFERLHLVRGRPSETAPQRTLLVLGGAGGVGSMAIQLAGALTPWQVVATASRPASREHCLALGADAVIDHGQPLRAQLKALGIRGVDAILCLTDPSPVFGELADILAPFGQVCSLVEASADLPMNLLRGKSASFGWEGMFTRSLFQTADMARQGGILAEVAGLVDAGTLRTTMRENGGALCAASLDAALARLAQGHMIGKLVLAGIDDDTRR
ncbi:MAG: zinc-binding alcohol dehydrogenase family protein [Burkholderiaceae bacterium]